MEDKAKGLLKQTKFVYVAAFMAKSRFIDASCNEPMKCMSSLFDPAKFPSTVDDPAFSDYGVPELKTLVAHYSELQGFS